MHFSAPTPVTLITGFLGSGKTTIISHLIDQLQPQENQIVYLKNEFGSEDIDAELMRGKHIQTRELLNGCICCTLVGPFVSAMEEIITTYHPQRIVIEASGSADPSAVALMISSHPLLQRDGVVSIVDVINFEGYQDLSQTARNQARFTDLIVFNKIEGVSLEHKQRTVGYVRELNDYAPIIEAPEGKVEPALIFGIATTELDSVLNATSPHVHSEAEHTNLSTLTLTMTTKPAIKTLEKWLMSLPGPVIRVKGAVHEQDGHQVLVNKVGGRVTFTELTEPVNLPDKLVLIGFGLEQLGVNWQESLDKAV